MRKYILSLSAVAMSALIHTAHATEQPDPSDPDCHVNVNTDNGKGGFQVRSCKDETSIGFSGPIKDVDKDHPVGKGDAFIPKAGRDAQRVVQDVGHGVEHGTHEVGKVFAHVFGW